MTAGDDLPRMSMPSSVVAIARPRRVSLETHFSFRNGETTPAYTADSHALTRRTNRDPGRHRPLMQSARGTPGPVNSDAETLQPAVTANRTSTLGNTSHDGKPGGEYLIVGPVKQSGRRRWAQCLGHPHAMSIEAAEDVGGTEPDIWRLGSEGPPAAPDQPPRCLVSQLMGASVPDPHGGRRHHRIPRLARLRACPPVHA